MFPLEGYPPYYAKKNIDCRFLPTWNFHSNLLLSESLKMLKGVAARVIHGFPPYGRLSEFTRGVDYKFLDVHEAAITGRSTERGKVEGCSSDG